MKNNRRGSARRARRTPSVLERIHVDVAGIDCGAAEHFVAVPPDRDATPIQSFRTFTADLERLADWLVACRVTSVAMEATGVYWIPVYDILDARGLEVLLVNARHVKNVPGRRSDVEDCEWLRELHSVGLLRGSFRPAGHMLPLRAYLRHREVLVQTASTIHDVVFDPNVVATGFWHCVAGNDRRRCAVIPLNDVNPPLPEVRLTLVAWRTEARSGVGAVVAAARRLIAGEEIAKESVERANNLTVASHASLVQCGMVADEYLGELTKRNVRLAANAVTALENLCQDAPMVQHRGYQMRKATRCFVTPLVTMMMTAMLLTSAALAQPSAIQLSIARPENGAVVPRRLAVTGSSTGLTTNTILVFVYAPAVNRWFFQGEAAVAADGSWEAATVVVSGGAISGAPGAGQPVDVQIVATAMRAAPAGLSGIPGDDFPLAGTLAQSAPVSVRREN